jgi:hypothetical protein
VSDDLSDLRERFRARLGEHYNEVYSDPDPPADRDALLDSMEAALKAVPATPPVTIVRLKRLSWWTQIKAWLLWW